jgi:hypothetical protein
MPHTLVDWISAPSEKKKNLKHIQNIFRETCKELGRKVTQGRHLPITMNTSACIYIH